MLKKVTEREIVRERERERGRQRERETERERERVKESERERELKRSSVCWKGKVAAGDKQIIRLVIFP